MKSIFQPAEGYVIPTNGIEVINEGNVMAVRFDIKEYEQPMGESEMARENMPQQYVCEFVRVSVGLSLVELADALAKEDYDKRKAMKVARAVLGIEDDLEYVKSEKIADVDEYDTSSEVNGFKYQGAEFWLPRETRVSVMNTANILKAAGVLHMDLWLGKVNVNLPVDDVIAMLAALEQYALSCYNITAKHKAEVEAMENIASVAKFDVTKGYPKKLEF